MQQNTISRVTAMYFSATGKTEKIALAVAGAAARRLGVPMRPIDLTTPTSRTAASKYLCINAGAAVESNTGTLNKTAPVQGRNACNAVDGFCSTDLVIFAVPVYIGRVPNLIAPFFKTIVGGGAVGIPVMTYGHRNYDDALRELWSIMREDGFRGISGNSTAPATVHPSNNPLAVEKSTNTQQEESGDCFFELPLAAAAFPAEHSFSRILGAGRPDAHDLELAEAFGRTVAEAVAGRKRDEKEELSGGEMNEVACFADGGVGTIEAGYFTSTEPMRFFKAVNDKGEGFDIRRVKPVTDTSKCTGCGLCAKLCPMGSIGADAMVNGICIKCGACVKRCPAGAKSFTDAGYLEHLSILERDFTAPRQKPSFFL